ncbi:hypothetical protein [Streptomyces clavuligerus]|uniref:hypothetical protein n=1 Tax=Streptomyces clavuligerus TaxID=1901 RepID=UPI0013C41EFB
MASMAAEPGSARAARIRDRIGSSEASAAAGSSNHSYVQHTSQHGSDKKILSRKNELSALGSIRSTGIVVASSGPCRRWAFDRRRAGREAQRGDGARAGDQSAVVDRETAAVDLDGGVTGGAGAAGVVPVSGGPLPVGFEALPGAGIRYQPSAMGCPGLFTVWEGSGLPRRRVEAI